MGIVKSINISSVKGVVKDSVNEANIIENWGLEGDAHAGDWDRQVSIFPIEAMDKVPPDKYEEVSKGGYTENITIEGIPLNNLSVGKILKIGEAEIKILYIGKDEYKNDCRPYIVSREGRFGKVLKGGKIRVGDKVEVVNK